MLTSIMFQFLIGTVKTEKKLEMIVLTSRFQFLIGTVKTERLKRIS